MGEDVHSCMALTSNDKLRTVRNSDKIYSFEVVCDYVSLMFRRQRCDFGSNEVAFQFFESVVPVQEVAEDIPVTELDNSSSSEEQPLPPAVDFSLTFSPKQWSHWIDMFSSESSQILNDSFCEEDDSPRTQQLKKAVQSQFFVKSLFPVEQKKRKRDNSKTSSPRIFGWTKWGRCDMCFNCLKPCVIWSGPLEGYPVLRCVWVEKTDLRNVHLRNDSRKIAFRLFRSISCTPSTSCGLARDFKQDIRVDRCSFRYQTMHATLRGKTM